MLKSANRACLAVLVTLFVAVAGCGKKHEATPFNDAEGLLRYVPADTPYFLGTLKPAPDEVFEKFEPAVREMLASYGDLLAELEDMLENSDEMQSEEDAAEMDMVLGILRGLKPLMSADAYNAAGISKESLVIVYGNGLLPVMRLGVSDSTLLDAWVADIEAEAGGEFAVGTIRNKSYRYADAEDMRIVIGTFDNQFILTFMPAGFGDDQLADLLGLDLPAENLAETNKLQEIADEYDYVAEFIGFMDMQLLADTFIDSPSGLNAAALERMEYDAGTLSDICQAELRGLAATMPRMVTGYEAISAERIDSSLVVEVRDDLAGALAAIPTAVPGLGKAFDGLFSIGMSMDLKAARAFYAARVEALENDPLRCELLRDLQNSVVAGREALNQPVPPVVYDFKGFLAVINDIDRLSAARQTPPESVDGSVLVAMENAAGLLALGQMMSPELYEMDIQPDGKPHRLDLPAASAAGIENAWIALTDDALAISVSEGGDARLPALLAADSTSPPPFMSMNMDAARYYALVAESMDAEATDGDTEQFQAAMSEMMIDIGSLYDRFMVDVHFTARGIEVSMDTTFAD
jgi:hypothetical protein